jgi:hypothetical protein
MTPQLMMPQKRKKKAAEPELKFDATLGTKSEDLELDLDSARFTAVKGQGGDRRA